MKTTIKELRSIIKEAIATSLEEGGINSEYGGTAVVDSNFRHSSIDEDTKRIKALLDDMETIIRDDTTLNPEDLDFFKNNNFRQLADKIDFIVSHIESRNPEE